MVAAHPIDAFDPPELMAAAREMAAAGRACGLTWTEEACLESLREMPLAKALAFAHETAAALLKESAEANGPHAFPELSEREMAEIHAIAEATERYGDDVARELADIEAGRHPLQQL